MYLKEKLKEKELIKIKIDELRNSLLVGFDIKEDDKIVESLLKYIDVLQNINLIINKVNQQTTLSIGNSEISTTIAVEIRKAIKTKIDIITQLINSGKEKLDILVLMEQRDSLIAEYNGIDTTIRIADWSVKLD